LSRAISHRQPKDALSLDTKRLANRYQYSMNTTIQAIPPKSLSPAFIALFFLANIMPALAVYGTAPILPLLEAHFAHHGMAASLSRATITVGSIGIVIGAPLTSYAARWFGRKALLVGAGALFTVAGLTGYFVDSLIIIVCSRFFVGVTAALVTTLAVTIVGEESDDAARNRWMGFMIGAGTFLTMLMFLLVGMLGDVGWQQAFLVHLVGIPITLLAWFGYRQTDYGASKTSATSAPVRFDLIALGLCIGVAINAQSIYAPFKLEEIGLQSATKIGLAMMVVPFMAAITSPFYGQLRRRASASLVFALGFAGFGCGLALFAAAPTLGVALCGYALFGGALGFVAPNMYVVGSGSDGSNHGGAALGQTLAGFYASSLVAQVLIEPLIGGRPALALLGLAGFCGVFSITSLIITARSIARIGPGAP
jgi:MFS family permease